MNMTEGDFLGTCKGLYIHGIHPFDSNNLECEPYTTIVHLSNELIKVHGLQVFLEYLGENQYRVNLWAAKLGLELGNPRQDEILLISGKDTIIDHCIEIVDRHVSFQTTEAQENNGKDWVKKIRTVYNKT